MRITFRRWMRRRAEHARKKMRILSIRKAMMSRNDNIFDR